MSNVWQRTVLNITDTIVAGEKEGPMKISEGEKFDVYDSDGVVGDVDEYNQHFALTDGWTDYLLGNAKI